MDLNYIVLTIVVSVLKYTIILFASYFVIKVAVKNGIKDSKIQGK